MGRTQSDILKVDLNTLSAEAKPRHFFCLEFGLDNG